MFLYKGNKVSTYAMEIQLVKFCSNKVNYSIFVFSAVK